MSGSEEMRFDGRVAIVTGAGRGIGRAYAVALAQRGCAVVVNDHGVSVTGERGTEEPAEETARHIRELGGRAIASVDSVVTGAETIVGSALEAFGRLDIVVNNAGIIYAQPFADMSLDDLDRHLDVHVRGTVAMCHTAWPHFVAAGYGRIVNTISAGMFGLAENTAYATAKGGIFAFTRSLALETGDLDITVNAISPFANTRMLRTFSTPSMPEQMAPAVVYLVHDSTELNGETLRSAGDRVARVLLGETDGITVANLSAETVRDRLSEVLDISSFRAFASARDLPA